MRLTTDEFCRRLAIARRIGLQANIPPATVADEILVQWVEGGLAKKLIGTIRVEDTDSGEIYHLDRWQFSLDGVECLVDLPRR